MKNNDVLKLLAAGIRNAGSLRAWSRAHDLSPAYVSGVMRGRYPPAGAILAALGLEREVNVVIRQRRRAVS
jgi:lambda repressor-like predicted transcriptional regulator